MEIRGALGSIPTALPGVRVGEVLPRIARMLDRVTVLRSLTHQSPIHGTAFAFSRGANDRPPARRQRPRPAPLAVHRFGGRLPRRPRRLEAIGRAAKLLAAIPVRLEARPVAARAVWRLPRPGLRYGLVGVSRQGDAFGETRLGRRRAYPRQSSPTRTSAFGRPIGSRRLAPDETITLDRLNGRTSLLDQLDSARRSLDASANEASFDRHRALARAVLTSGKLRDALDVQREPAKLRERYGMTLFGQSCLAARRVLEAGGKFVTVCWDEYGLVNTGWDTHVHQTPRLKDELGPGLDNAFATLLDDLDARGMLADTAVVVLSEHGRTPRVQNVDGGGRDHWARAYSGLFAGAGFAKGRVVGRTDRIGGDVIETPFSPKDVVATLFHLLGIDPQGEIHDRLGRPYVIGGIGRVRDELLG